MFGNFHQITGLNHNDGEVLSDTIVAPQTGVIVRMMILIKMGRSMLPTAHWASLTCLSASIHDPNRECLGSCFRRFNFSKVVQLKLNSYGVDGRRALCLENINCAS